MIKAAIFDMDGLMFDTERYVKEIWDEIGGELGYEHVSEVMPLTMGRRLNTTADIFAEHFGPEFPFFYFLPEYRRRMSERIEREGVPVKKGLRNLLEYLKEEKIVCAVASSTVREKVLCYCGKAGITGYFAQILGGDTTEKCKPDPQIYLTAAQAVGEKPENCLVLEDSPNGCLAGYRAGMKVVMVPDQVQPDAKLRALVSACVPSLLDVIPLLESRKEA